MKMKLLISLTFLLCQWGLIACDQEFVELPDIPDFRKTREKSPFNLKSSQFNAITNDYTKSTPPSTTLSQTSIQLGETSQTQPIRLTLEDVVTGSNSVYGSHFDREYQSKPNYQLQSQYQTQQPPQLSNGGIIFAISQGQGQRQQNQDQGSTSQSFGGQMQPVLMQYLSQQGTPQQNIQYIQLLRPLMMVPASPYLPPKHISLTQPQQQSPTQTTSIPASPPTKHHMLHPYGPYSRQPLQGSFSTKQLSYLHSNPRPPQKQPSFDMGLNLNEYLPSASSIISAVLSPRSSITSQPQYKPTKFQALAQRA